MIFYWLNCIIIVQRLTMSLSISSSTATIASPEMPTQLIMLWAIHDIIVYVSVNWSKPYLWVGACHQYKRGAQSESAKLPASFWKVGLPHQLLYRRVQLVTNNNVCTNSWKKKGCSTQRFFLPKQKARTGAKCSVHRQKILWHTSLSKYPCD